MLPKSLRPLSPYLKKYWRGFAWGTLCVLLLNGIWVQFPQVLQRALDHLKNGGRGVGQLGFYALLLILIAASKGVFQFLTRWIVIGISRDIEFDLRNDMFQHLERLCFPYYQRNRTGDIMARATNDLNAVRMLLGPAIMYSANTLVFTAGALAYMIKISPKLTVYTFLPLPVASIVIQYFGRQIHERFEKIQAMFSDISARAQENFSGARVIRAYVQEVAEIKQFEAANNEYIARSLPLARLMGLLWPTLELTLGLAVVLVLWLGGREVLMNRMTVGQFAAFLTYMVQLTWPVIALGWVINIFQRGTASLSRIDEILQEKPEIADDEAVVAAGPPEKEFRGEIEFRDLNFSYGGTLVLRDVNLQIPEGSSLAIVGPTGSGKTTLVSLIPRVYDAAPDTVFIDGRPIREYPIEFLRRNIGFVPQETFLFSDTVGERGLTLSGGQKQRTAIARAIIRNPRILILDDALSSVDTQTEDKILNHLRELMQGRTTIFISHRVSTVRNADRIAVLHGGRIVELGTHEELIARNGYYTDLYNKQLLEEELAEV